MKRRCKKIGFEYKKQKQKIPLTTAHKENRLAATEDWLDNDHPWEKTVFTDEKKLDGPDNWSSWMDASLKVNRSKRQMGIVSWERWREK